MVAAAPVSAQDDAAGSGFLDVTGGVFKPGIDALAALGVFEGTECAERMFCPGDDMKRWTMGVWLVRVLDDEEPAAVSESSFADVDASEWWLAHVERLAEREVTKGCATEPLRFCPDGTVSRDQMATFLVRAFDLEAAEPAGFTDTAGNFHETDIDALAAARVTAGCVSEPLQYCPDKPVTRAEMATFLARALGLVEVPQPAEEEQTAEEPSVDPSSFISVSAGYDHSCGVRGDGTIVCWGDNTYWQLNVPDGTYTAVSAGSFYSCGLRTDETVVCWIHSTDGRSDDPAGTFSAVSTGANHTCGLRTDGTVQCWGSNVGGDGSHAGQSDPPAGTFVAVDVGAWYSCGVRTDGTATCWGANTNGQADAPAGTFSAVHTGWIHSCGLRTDGTIACWGSNEWRGSYAGQSDPPAGTFSAVTVGWSNSCGLRTDGTVTCWGADTDFNGRQTGQSDPPAGTFTAIDSHAHHTCGLRGDGSVTCWGANTSGQAEAPGAP